MKAGNDSKVELLHLVARAADGARPLHTRVSCADLWSRLGTRFDVVACTLMPDHVHLLARAEAEGALRVFAQILASFRARVARARGDTVFDWEPLPRPAEVRRDPRHVARTIRYIHLNPCRDALCDDPLEWEWSTHRDWTGAVVRKCVNVGRWGRMFGQSPATVGRWMHEYVCSDASVPRTRPLADPRPYLGAPSADASLGSLAASVTRVLRSARAQPGEFDLEERRLYVLSAARWTRYRAPELAKSIGCHPTSVRRLLRGVRDPGRLIEDEAESTAVQEHVAGRSARSMRPMSTDEALAMALTLADVRLRWDGLSSGVRPR